MEKSDKKKLIRTSWITALSVTVVLATVLILFSCSNPDVSVPVSDVWKSRVPGSTWQVKEGRTIVSSSVPSFIRNASSVSFSSSEPYSVSVIVETESVNAGTFSFTGEDSGEITVYNPSLESNVKLSVHFSEGNMRIKFSSSDYMDFSLN